MKEKHIKSQPNFTPGFDVVFSIYTVISCYMHQSSCIRVGPQQGNRWISTLFTGKPCFPASLFSSGLPIHHSCLLLSICGIYRTVMYISVFLSLECLWTLHSSIFMKSTILSFSRYVVCSGWRLDGPCEFGVGAPSVQSLSAVLIFKTCSTLSSFQQPFKVALICRFQFNKNKCWLITHGSVTVWLQLPPMIRGPSPDDFNTAPHHPSQTSAGHFIILTAFTIIFEWLNGNLLIRELLIQLVIYMK